MKVPAGYTADELDRDNPFNQWMREDLQQEPGLCPVCNGSGEGQYEGTTCHACKGTGEQT